MAAAFYAAAHPGSGFPYDAGDDPSFFSAAHYRGPITWGVCRRDLRCSIRKNDGVIFFAAQKDPQDNETIRYRFVAALRVADKMQHISVCRHPTFSHYLNLLVRPKDLGWEHHEPVAKHNDWLWRLSCRTSSLRRKDYIDAGHSHTPGQSLMIDGQSLPTASNYVVFSTSSAIIAPDPPLVARYCKGEPHESWQNDETSTEVRRLTLRNSDRHLRTCNRQQPHRHIHHRNLKELELDQTFLRFNTIICRP
jgi:hypothetical protein